MGKKHWNEPWNGGAEIRPGIPRLRGLTESLPVAAMVADPLGSPLVVNDRFRDLLGEPPAEGWLSLVEPGERAAAESAWLLAGIARAMREVELGFSGVAGPFRATCRVAPLEEEGRVLGWAITLAEAAPDLSAPIAEALAGRTEAEERLRDAEERERGLEDRLAAAELRQRELEDQVSQDEARRHEAEELAEAAGQRQRQLEELLASGEAARLEVEARLAGVEAQLRSVADRLAEAEARRGEVEAHLAGVEAARREVEVRLADAQAARHVLEERLVDGEAQRRELAGLLADSQSRASEAEARAALADAHRREAERRQAEAESRLTQALARLTETEARHEAVEQALSLARAEIDGALAERDAARAMAERWAEAADDAETRLVEALDRAEAAQHDPGERTGEGMNGEARLAADQPLGAATPVASDDEPAGGSWSIGRALPAEEHAAPVSLGDTAEQGPDADGQPEADMGHALAASDHDGLAEEPELAGVVALGDAASAEGNGSAEIVETTSADISEAPDRSPETAEPPASDPDAELVADDHQGVAIDPIKDDQDATDPTLLEQAGEVAPIEPASDDPIEEPELAVEEAHAASVPEPDLSAERGEEDAAPADQGSESEPAMLLDAEAAGQPDPANPGEGDADAEATTEAPFPAEVETPAGILEPDDGAELDQLAARLRSGLLRAALGHWRAGRGRSGMPPFQLWDEASTDAGQVVIEMDEAGVPVRLRVVRSLAETPLLRALSAPPGGEGHGWRRCAATGRPAHDYAEVGLGPEGGHSLERLLLPFSVGGTHVDRLVLLLVTEEVGQAELPAGPAL